ncbi:MAG: glycoside hydrolase family 3 N-terminal domain-containing protein [Candidatus Eisenbacteria bacterium]
MELTRKIARLVMSSFSDRPGDDLAEQYHRLRREVVELGVGGYIIFGGNVDSTAQLTRALADEASQPLLVASDLERGLGQQLDGGTVFPTQMAVGATGVTDLAFAQGWATAREALSVGLDLVFSPVADVASEPTNPIIGIRAYGGDATMVADMTAAFVRGCQQAGAAATAKHFPGHGDTRLDSHIELPSVAADRATLESREFVPFRAAIGAGVKVIMTAHVAYPALTGGDVPATLSRAIMTDLLRGDMGFDGVLVTDALMMGGIAERYACGEAAVMALEAGVDILLMPPDVESAISAVREAVRAGRVTEERIDLSLERIDALHKWLGDYREADDNHVEFPPEIAGAFGHEDLPDCNHRVGLNKGHEVVADHIARRAITLLRDDAGLVPLDAASLAGKRVAVFTLKDSDRSMNLVWFRSRLEGTLPDIRDALVDERATPDELDRLAASAASSDVSIVAVFDDVVAWKGRSGPSEELLGTARRLIEAAPRAVVLAFTGPSIALELPDASTLICCYDASEPLQNAAVEALFGEVPLIGRLPVDVPPLFTAGSGLER